MNLGRLPYPRLSAIGPTLRRETLENPLQVIVRSCRESAGLTDAVDVAVVCTATAAEHVDMGEAAE